MIDRCVIKIRTIYINWRKLVRSYNILHLGRGGCDKKSHKSAQENLSGKNVDRSIIIFYLQNEN